jgi:hypothetical protein
MATPSLAAAVERRFALFGRLGVLDRRGMHLIDPWPIGSALGLERGEIERALGSLAEIGWIDRIARGDEERVVLTVRGLARR